MIIEDWMDLKYPVRENLKGTSVNVKKMTDVLPSCFEQDIIKANFTLKSFPDKEQFLNKFTDLKNCFDFNRFQTFIDIPGNHIVCNLAGPSLLSYDFLKTLFWRSYIYSHPLPSETKEPFEDRLHIKMWRDKCEIIKNPETLSSEENESDGIVVAFATYS
ncbi:hypothetical protein Anas_08627, partial [Armadillidium nasatum]